MISLLKRVSGRVFRHVPSTAGGRRVRHMFSKMVRRAPIELTIAKGDTVVMVGAVNHGEVWDMVRMVGPQGRVVVVEALPENVAAIEASLRQRRPAITNLTVICKAAWSEPARITLHCDPRWPAGGIILNSGTTHDRGFAPEAYARALALDADQLDTILLNVVDRCDFIKITVMGAELRVLDGMDRLLSECPAVWVRGHALLNDEPTNRVIERRLAARGFVTMVTRPEEGYAGFVRSGDVYAVRYTPGP